MYEEFRNRMSRRGSFMGETMRLQSDVVANATWLNSVAARRVQVKWLNQGLPPEYATSYEFEDPIDAHFELKSEYSIANGASPYYLTFRPGELLRHPDIKVGAYVSIPNADNIPEWWMIVFIEDDNESNKLYIMKCNWTFKWVFDGKIYSHLGILLNGSSSREVDENAYTTVVNGNGTMWMATNADTQTLRYGQRLLISDKGRMPPLCYSISDIIDTRPVGLTKFVLSQNTFDATHDDAERMLANYNDSYIKPNDSKVDDVIKTATITYNGIKPIVKVGGSFKVFTASFNDENITVDKWIISDDKGNDISADTDNYTIEYSNKQMKLKVAQNYELITRVLTIKAIGSDDSIAEISVEVI